MLSAFRDVAARSYLRVCTCAGLLHVVPMHAPLPCCCSTPLAPSDALAQTPLANAAQGLEGLLSNMFTEVKFFFAQMAQVGCVLSSSSKLTPPTHTRTHTFQYGAHTLLPALQQCWQLCI